MITVYCIELFKSGAQMLRVICLISLLSSSILLTACGQSGALQLPSDPNYDHRAKYLLYRNKESKQVVQKDEKAEQQRVQRIDASHPTRRGLVHGLPQPAGRVGGDHR